MHRDTQYVLAMYHGYHIVLCPPWKSHISTYAAQDAWPWLILDNYYVRFSCFLWQCVFFPLCHLFLAIAPLPFCYGCGHSSLRSSIQLIYDCTYNRLGLLVMFQNLCLDMGSLHSSCILSCSFGRLRSRYWSYNATLPTNSSLAYHGCSVVLHWHGFRLLGLLGLWLCVHE